MLLESEQGKCRKQIILSKNVGIPSLPGVIRESVEGFRYFCDANSQAVFEVNVLP